MASSEYHQIAIMPQSLRARAGGLGPGASSSAKLSSALSIQQGDDDNNISSSHEESSLAAAKKALQSMKFCYKWCFLSVAADLLTSLVDGTVRPKVFGLTPARWSRADCIGVFSSLDPLLFGAGLWYIARLYHESFLKISSSSSTSNDFFDRRMTRDNLISLFRTKSWIWGAVALNVALASVSLGTALPELAKDGMLPFFLRNAMSSKRLSLVIAGILGLGFVLVRRECDREARREFQCYEERNGMQEQQQLTSSRMKLDVIRAAGFQAYLNQALCAGSFGLMGGLQLIKWIATFDGNIVNHALLMFDFLTPFALGSLLFLLNKAMIRAAIAEVMADPTRGADRSEEIYHDLFVAGSGFYNKVGETFKYAALFHFLPYIVAPIASFILKGLKKISIFAKAIKYFGIDK